jgi:UPF0042 nucleotide-binding protein
MKSKLSELIILTGYSGSGKSSGLRILENMGFYCVDNLPARLLKNFVDLMAEKKLGDKVAVVIDARGVDFMRGLEKDLDQVGKKLKIKVIFFEADLDTITNRYKALRFRHPLALKGTIQEGYRAETNILSALRQRAHLIIDTNQLNVHSLRALIDKYVNPVKRKEFQIYLRSFGYKYGLPQESDIIIDVRSLINPYFEPSLKHKTGKNKQVQDFIFSDPASRVFLRKTLHYLNYLLKRCQEDGKNFIHVAFGCTGGKHRSVAVIEVIRPLLQRKNKKFTVIHRDINLE